MNLGRARAQGVDGSTASRRYREGTFPVPVRKVGRLILVSPDTATSEAGSAGVGLYARVSSHDQRSDLDRQVSLPSAWAAQAGLSVVRVEAEVASGVNGARMKVRRPLADPAVSVVVVELRGRLGWMNTELVEAALSAQQWRLVVLDDAEVTEDLVRDMVELLTSFCARLYAPRSARNRALKASGCAARDIGPQVVVAAGKAAVCS